MFNRLRSNWHYLLLTPLLFTALETAFIKHNGISILSSEALFTYLILIFLGLIPGLLMVFGGVFFRVIIASILLILLILSQINTLPVLPWGFKYRYVFPLFIMSTSVLFYTIRLHLGKLFFVIFGVFWVGAFFTSKTPMVDLQQVATIKAANQELPPYIEIILDEHIGIDGLARLENSDHEFSKKLVNDYIEKGFRVYGDAYSRDYQTLSSFASFLNFHPLKQVKTYIGKEKGINSIITNKLFEEITKSGYQINVLQSTFLSLCVKKDNINLKTCRTYNHAAPVPYPYAKLTEKSAVILNNVFSFIPPIDFFLKYKNKIWSMLHLPTSNTQGLVEASTATYVVSYPELMDLAKNVEQGNAYFVHLLMPHYPYVFDENCQYVGNRGKKASTYIEQVKCTQKMMDEFLRVLAKNPNAKKSIVVIHGDHGTRMPTPRDNKKYSFTTENIIKTYNTFFVVKAPSYNAGYDQNKYPLDYLLKTIVLGKKLVPYDPAKQFVYLRSDSLTDKPFDLGKELMPASEDSPKA